jgi:hypothetical protein
VAAGIAMTFGERMRHITTDDGDFIDAPRSRLSASTLVDGPAVVSQPFESSLQWRIVIAYELLPGMKKGARHDSAIGFRIRSN